MTADVTWEDRWEHSECSASGEALFPDEDSPAAGHDGCPEPGDVGWYGQWECICGAGGDGEWEDGDRAASGHECDDENKLDDEVEETAA
ncbi:hypothetical protein [Streptomyces actinomycinicus]|uniref:hypothetical protein n=1 Tax=Streptomyces actinomycinicus TaxID=1695166 RepID=UPI0027D9DCEC|nr:hypothetical protein [Streptomyces actinomycinicus]